MAPRSTLRYPKTAENSSARRSRCTGRKHDSPATPSTRRQTLKR
jgi:hypothetical protein